MGTSVACCVLCVSATQESVCFCPVGGPGPRLPAAGMQRGASRCSPGLISAPVDGRIPVTFIKRDNPTVNLICSPAQSLHEALSLFFSDVQHFEFETFERLF